MCPRQTFRQKDGEGGLKRQALLTLNTGSSSIKLSAYEVSEKTLGDCLLSVNVSGFSDRLRFLADTPHDRLDTVPEALASSLLEPESRIVSLARWAADTLEDVEIMGVGHRIVHGGPAFQGPVLATANKIKQLRGLACLAPLHQPANLDGVEGIICLWPAIPQSLSFDTAFHRNQPRVAQLYAVPRGLTDDGLLRFGFHGLSYAHIAEQLKDRTSDGKHFRTVAAHLGSGASVCAMLSGQSVATSMGLTALDGIPMATRSGSIDPGLLLHLIMDRGMSAADVSSMLYNESGLLGLSGISGDVRELLESSESAAAEALDVYTYRIAREIGSLTTALNGLDTLVFTGGVGENSAPIRQMICDHLEWLGVKIDPNANQAGLGEIQSPLAKVHVLVIPANEEAVIAKETLSVVAGS